MKIIALISSGVVINTVIWNDNDPSQQWINDHSGIQYIDVTALTPQPGIGWSYIGTAFTAPAQPAPTVDQLKQATFSAALAAGFDTGLGWSLPLDDGARSLITSGAALITSAILGYQLTNNTAAITALLAANYDFTDITGTLQTVTTQQALNINIGYGQYYKQIWSAAQ